MYDIETIPPTVALMMQRQQILQGNNADMKIFANNPTAGANAAGFTWKDAETLFKEAKYIDRTDIHRYWRKIIEYKAFETFFI